ncbi:insecticidal toxin complex protein TccC [Pseudomonas sp. 3296]|uniref:RHS repeat-associated core domain-containing protein n=1 Tax=Pseudomonas sp. 3296 TaxID=2817753 RepID=UPI002865C20F|nr:RHS repeat-associated core domain-containing protein [Pseudomonas sp. 3296]MDR6916149.1 insecticidal toxin complex protein TccC [Pseudomonas sp. 3296]
MSRTVDWKTPLVKAVDGRRLTVRQMTYLRSVPDGPVETHITRQRFDTLGRLVEQRDARLANASRPNLSTIYDLAGHPVNVDSVDAGRRTNLKGLAGEVLQSWDGRGNHWRSTYDNQLRMLMLEESGHGVVDTDTYASALADPNYNLRGRMIRQTDPSGALEFSSFSLKGQPLRDSRTVTEAGTFASSRTYNPHGALLTQTDAFHHQQRMRYDIAGQLQQVHLLLEPTGTWQAVLEAARYNAAGQIIEQRAGNNVFSRWLYDEADARLTTFTAGVPGQDLLQHFEYVYDRVGNVLHIDDLTFEPVYHCNQLINGRRTFTHNSFYQLTSATGRDATPGSEMPGRPLPSDPNNHLNYKQRYEYDEGGSLIKLTHERAVGGYTHKMFIDPNSNRGVRWKEADPAPDFDSLFDRHGNQQVLASGRSLHWNSRDQLASATLVERENNANDEESYRYSQGVRLLKRHEWQGSTLTHFRQVIYLPGLEIRTRDDGETLHVITLPGGRGCVRCLHWASKKPDGIDQDQLRYTLDDQLGSCLMELDQAARLISHEGYYPFGGTAWLKAASLLEVGYKTIRYSGKEMDECGLYYYGARYYAPWLQRWVSADPAGAADGLNLYQFVGNNPLRYVDHTGETKAESVIYNYSRFISALNGYADQTLQQLDNVIHQTNIGKNLVKGLVVEGIKGAIGYEGGVMGSGQAGLVLPQASHALQFTDPNALIGGNLGGDVAGALENPMTSGMGLTSGALIPQTSTMSIAAIDQELGLAPAARDVKANWKSIRDQVIRPALNSTLNPGFMMNRVMASWLSIIPGAINSFQRAIEAEDIKNRLDPVKINKIEGMLTEWKSTVEERWASADAAFNALGTDVIYPADQLPNVNFMTSPKTLAPIHRSVLQAQTRTTLDYIARAQTGLAWYREMSTTDNQFLARQARTVKRKAA